MNEVENGLFLIEENMPCTPRDIQIGHYFLGATLGKPEKEEAAARILYFCHQLDQWVGVSFLKIIDMMREDYAKAAKLEFEMFAYDGRMELWKLDLRHHFWLCLLTLGLYGLFVPKPQRPLKLEPEEVPLTGIYLFGPGYVLFGLHKLVREGMLVRTIEGKNENAVDVFFPTPKLISHIMRAQGIAS